MNRAERRRRTQVAIQKQINIIQDRHFTHIDTTKRHRFAKHHAMDCGNPKCKICGNPRRINNELTIQELKFNNEPI